MKDFIITNIRLTKGQYSVLKSRAVREKKSVAWLIRDAVSKTYGPADTRQVTEEEWRNAPFWKLCGIYKGGGQDDCLDHDEILYGPITYDPGRPKT